MEYWQKDIETMNREDLKKLQFERLRKTIEAAGNSPSTAKFSKKTASQPTVYNHWTICKRFLLRRKTTFATIIRTAWRLFLSRTVSVSIRQAVLQETQQSYCIRPETWTNGLTK